MKENKQVNYDKIKLLHICEVCGKQEFLYPQEAYEAGWDYPPKMGQFKILSPRTCPNCTMDKTVWWELMMKKKTINDLTDNQKETIKRILNEPDSIIEKDTN